MPAWLMNADEIRIAGDFDESLLCAAPKMQAFLWSDRNDQFIVVGPRGSGRTFLLKAKRIRCEREGRVTCLPHDSLVDKLSVPASAFNDEALRFFTASPLPWVNVWLAACGLAALKASDEADPAKFGPRIRSLLLDSRLRSAVSHVVRLLSSTPTELQFLGNEIDSHLLPRLRALQRPLAFFLDGLDSSFDGADGPWASMRVLAQTGLIETAYQLHQLNRNLKVYAAVHEAAVDDLRQRTALSHRYNDTALRIEHPPKSLRQMFARNAGLLEPEALVLPERKDVDPIQAFLGDRRVYGDETDAFEFIRRHTLQRPRDLMRMGHRLGMLAPAERALPGRLQEVVRDVAADIADEYLVELAARNGKRDIRRVAHDLPAPEMTRAEMDSFCDARGAPVTRLAIEALVKVGLLEHQRGDGRFIAHPALTVLIRRLNQSRERQKLAVDIDVRFLSPAETAALLTPELRAMAVSQAVDVRFAIPWDDDEERLVTLVCEAQPPDLTVGLLDPGFALLESPQMAVVALFPSGTARTVGTARLMGRSSVVLEFFDYWSLLDPDDTESQLGETVAGRAHALAVYVEAQPS